MRLLVIKPSSFGDIVHGLQVVTTARASREDLEVTWVVRDRFAPLVERCPAVDRVISYEADWSFAALPRNQRGRRF
jgi:ADP-heptose:LPS heptosyltransferase